MSLSENVPKSYFDVPDDADKFVYHRKYNPPDYSHWIKVSCWTIEESVHLIHGVEPGFYTNLSERDSVDNAEFEIKKTKMLLELDIVVEKVKTDEKDFLNPTEVIYWANLP